MYVIVPVVTVIGVETGLDRLPSGFTEAGEKARTLIL